MSEQLRSILAMLIDGEISVENAQQVIEALTAPRHRKVDKNGALRRSSRARALHIQLHRPPGDGRLEKDVNIHLPIGLVCGGMRLGMLIPGIGDRINARLRARGVDLDLGAVNEEQLESMFSRLGQVTIDVSEGGHHKQLRVTCE